jgi:hypothetical protein
VQRPFPVTVRVAGREGVAGDEVAGGAVFEPVRQQTARVRDGRDEALMDALPQDDFDQDDFGQDDAALRRTLR